MFGQNRYGRPFASMDIKRQAMVIVDVFGNQHKSRSKNTSFTTKKFRAYVLHQMVEDIIAAGYKINSILCLDQRHIGALIALWMEKGLSNSTIQNRMSAMRWLAIAIGKGGLLRNPEAYGLNKADLRRVAVAQEDKSWTQRGTIPDELIQKAKEADIWAGNQLAMMKAFGLRVSEAILMRPRTSTFGDVLKVEEGTKGGRTRVVPIRTDEQRRVLAQASELSMRSRKGALVSPDRTVQQERRRLYYVCEKLGITKAQLSITPHGLRHEYANDRYEEISGTPSVVRGGSAILDEEAEANARHAVSTELGHKRLSITSAYTGPSKRHTNLVQRHLDRREAAKESAADAVPGEQDG